MTRLFIIFFFGLTACSESKTRVTEKKSTSFQATDKQEKVNTVSKKEPEAPDLKKPSTLIAKPIFDATIGWGYDIYDGTKLMIHQPNIPAVQGNKGFQSADQAIIVANKVIEKLDSGIMPPSLSEKELIELGVDFSK